jgi:hypothetical protein
METLSRMFDFVFSSELILLLAVAILLLGMAEAGHHVGLRLYRAKDEVRRSLIGGVQGAVLGLLALLLGFTFAMAVNRYDTRRDLVVKEANTIGTSWLRAGLLPEAHRAPVKDLLRRYVDVRLKYEALSRDPHKLAEGLRISAELQNELWKHAEAVATTPTPITVTFITALNELIDTDAERIAAARNQIPTGVWVLLVIVAGFGCFTTSYGSGAHGARSLFTNISLPLMITIVITLVFDLTHARQGVIGISQQPLIDLQTSIQPKP